MQKRFSRLFVVVFMLFLSVGIFSAGIAQHGSENENTTMDFPLDEPGLYTNEQYQKDEKPFLPGTGHDGPELKEFYESLGLSPEERYQNEGLLVDNVYSPLFKRLALPVDAQNEFRDLLITVRITWNDLEEEVRKGGTSEKEIKKGFKKMGSSAWELDGRVEKLLGNSNYKKYNEYKSSLGIFMTDAVDEFEKDLNSEEQIDNKQEGLLVTAMAEEFEGFLTDIVGRFDGPPSYRVELRDKDVAKKINANLEDLKKRYFERAQRILNETQLLKYKRVIESKINNRKSWSEEKVVEIEELSKTKKVILYRDFRDS